MCLWLLIEVTNPKYIVLRDHKFPTEEFIKPAVGDPDNVIVDKFIYHDDTLEIIEFKYIG